LRIREWTDVDLKPAGFVASVRHEMAVGRELGLDLSEIRLKIPFRLAVLSCHGQEPKVGAVAGFVQIIEQKTAVGEPVLEHWNVGGF
jgi:hypothetical protein